MSLDIVFAGISFGIAVVNSIAVAGVYVKYIRDARKVVCTIRATKDGEIEYFDPLSLMK